VSVCTAHLDHRLALSVQASGYNIHGTRAGFVAALWQSRIADQIERATIEASMKHYEVTRRALLAGTASFGAVSLVESAAVASLVQTPPKLKVIITGGHPGDPEYGCGGTAARLAELGHDVILLYLNDGEPRGRTRESDKGKRVSEARKACEILGARPVFAGQIDGDAIVDRAHYDAFRVLLEAQRPHAVFTHWPIDNHADHRAMFMLVYDAWLRMGRRFALYFYEVSNGEDTLQFAPSHYVDITATESKKRQACYAHASQSPDKFYALQEQVMKFRGIERGFRYAEGFVRHVQSPDLAIAVGL
jgi:LmbE family N-acetylglucosaminyl deacetylase